MLKASVAFEANIDNEILISPPNFIETNVQFLGSLTKINQIFFVLPDVICIHN